MQCPKCQFDNREGAKFCLKCGEKLEFKCPACGRQLPREAMFCDECGNKLTFPSEPSPKELSFDEKIEKIQKYLPKGLTEKILSQRDRIEGERKQVTVMFSDMEGFTPLSEMLGIEEAYAIIDQVYEILIHKVHDYEGTVNELTGDGIMALFGAPIALEDAPQRAIRSSLAIHREMAKFSDKLKKEKKDFLPFKMRIGIHTGPVVVGAVGNDLRVDFKAVGDTVNLASRMEGQALAGTTYITEDTFKLTEGFFRFEALGEKEVKGKKEPVNVYRVIAPSARRTRFDVSAERGLTPFVGRERELDLLLDGFERAKTARGQAFSIMAEAGAGKSRLLYEFRKAVANEDLTFLEGKCLSYSRGVAYHPLIDVLKSNFDVREDDGDSEIRQKVKRQLKILGADEASTLPYLLELLSVKDSGIDEIPMSPEAKKDRIIEAVKRITLKGSEIRPLIWATEDLHWIDRSSEDYLKNLLDSISGARVFLLFTYRPEFVHTWGGRSYHSQVNLNRLSNRESLLMASHLLGTDDIDRDLEDLILEKTEGVPFFIEEFIRSLKDLNILKRENHKCFLAREVRDVTIPSTIQDVIMARVDALPEGPKEVLQTGSAIEREFGFDLMEQVTGLPEKELLSYLSVLKDSELLYERGIYPQSIYIFKHALTQEVVYDSMLTKRKKKLHEVIGNAIEELYKKNIDEYYGILTEHFIESDNYEKGAEYSKLAGKRAQKAASFKEAVEYAKKTVLSLERLPETDAIQRKIIDARTLLAGYNIGLSHHVEAKEAVSPIANLALKLNYQKRLPMIYTTMGMYSHWVEENYSEGFQYLTEALKISEGIGDHISLWFAGYYLGITVSWNCEFKKGLEYFNKSLSLSVSANNPIRISITKSAIGAFNHIFHGEIDLAYRISNESLLMAHEVGDIYIKGMAYSSYGAICYCKGLIAEAEKNLSEGLALCEKTAEASLSCWASGWLGEIYVELGDYERAQAYYKKAIAHIERRRLMPSWINLWKVALARAKVLNNDQDINMSEVLGYFKCIRIKVVKGWTARYIGEILLNIDDQHISEAENWVKKAIEVDISNGTIWSLSKNYAIYSELFKLKKDLSKAKENLKRAIDISRECGADGWVGKYEKELATIS